MPRSFQLSYLAASRRWRKIFRGKSYYFPLRDHETKLSSYSRVLDEWNAKKQQLLGSQYSADFEFLGKLLEISKKAKSIGLWSEILRLEEIASHAFANGVERPSVPSNSPAPTSAPGLLLANIGDESESKAVRASRKRLGTMVDEVAHEYKALPQTVAEPWNEARPIAQVTVGKLKADLLAERTGDMEVERISRSRLDMIDRHLSFFVAWFGEHRAVSAIDASTLAKYSQHLAACAKNGDCSSYTSRDRLACLKQFLRWGFERGAIDVLPRNISSRSLRIEVTPIEIAVFEKVEITTLLAGAGDLMKLYLLLALNCGLTQKDIADLVPEEIDYKAGRIKRKRSKTRKHSKVPSVDFVLWPETLRLLKKLKSKSRKHVLLGEAGEPLYQQVIVNGKMNRYDWFHNAWLQLNKDLKIKNQKQAKLLRKTAATLIAEIADHSVATTFLGHAPSGVAAQHYIRPSQDKLDNAVMELGRRLGVVKCQES